MSDLDARFNELSAKIDAIPEELPPIVVHRPHLWVSITRAAFEILALIGLLVLLVGQNNARLASCAADNEFRLDIAGVLYERGQRPDATDNSRAVLAMEISRFALVDCDNPAKPRTPVTVEMARLSVEREKLKMNSTFPEGFPTIPAPTTTIAP